MSEVQQYHPEFEQKWTIWEGIKITPQEQKQTNIDYNKFLSEVIEFNTVQQFITIMHQLPHALPSRLFTDQEKLQLRKFKLKEKNDEMRQIESVCLFKSGIHPSWEHEQNCKGGQIQYNFGYLEEDAINNIWNKMVIDLVSGEIANFDKINGIRILEKFVPSRKIKVEYWYNEDISKDKKAYEQLVSDNKEYFREFVKDIEQVDIKFNLSFQAEVETKKVKKDKTTPRKEQ